MRQRCWSFHSNWKVMYSRILLSQSAKGTFRPRLHANTFILFEQGCRTDDVQCYVKSISQLKFADLFKPYTCVETIVAFLAFAFMCSTLPVIALHEAQASRMLCCQPCSVRKFHRTFRSCNLFLMRNFRSDLALGALLAQFSEWNDKNLLDFYC